MTRLVDQLTLNGAMTLLSYLQCSHLSASHIKVEAIAATLCQMLSQLETEFPGITREYGWEKIVDLAETASPIANIETLHHLDNDRNS